MSYTFRIAILGKMSLESFGCYTEFITNNFSLFSGTLRGIFRNEKLRKVRRPLRSFLWVLLAEWVKITDLLIRYSMPQKEVFLPHYHKKTTTF